MPETRGKTLTKILGDKQEPKSFTAERQHTAQAFNLHVERKDGRQSEGFAWTHYAGYRWTDEGSVERLVVLFGMRAIEIEGHHLGVLVEEIREGKLTSILELASREKTQLEENNPDNQPIIASVKTYPDFEQLLKEIKGENERENGHVGRLER